MSALVARPGAGLAHSSSVGTCVCKQKGPWAARTGDFFQQKRFPIPKRSSGREGAIFVWGGSGQSHPDTHTHTEGLRDHRAMRE